jgi:hypothetical protein
MSMRGFAQKVILYEVASCVQDSLKSGIAKSEKMFRKPWKELNMAVVVDDRDGDLYFILQEYLNLPPGGLSDLIKYSNRLLVVDENIKLPVLFPADRLSEGIGKDRIAYIPLTGYYVKVVYELGQQKVVETGDTF